MRLLSILVCAVALCDAQHILPERWIASGEAAALTTDGDALTLRYDATPGSRGMAVLPLRNLPVSDMKSLRFELRADAPFAVAVVLSEKKPDGGNYMATVWSDGASWQPVVLTPRDFTQADGARDPADPDNKLDLDRLQNLALLDFTQAANAAASNRRVYSEPHRGPHTISIRNFEWSREAPAGNTPAASIDAFNRPQVAWFTAGGAALSLREGALTVQYRQRPDQWVAWSRLIPPGDYAGAARLAMNVRSDREAQLVISIRERRGGQSEGRRFNVDFLVPAGKTVEHREVVLSAFRPQDGNGTIDLSALQTISFLDVTGESADNKIEIADLRLTK